MSKPAAGIFKPASLIACTAWLVGVWPRPITAAVSGMADEILRHLGEGLGMVVACAEDLARRPNLLQGLLDTLVAKHRIGGSRGLDRREHLVPLFELSLLRSPAFRARSRNR